MNAKLLLVGFALSNMSALVYEVVWAKELSYVFGTSIYAISTVLTCFMVGLAFGSYWLGKLVDRSSNPLKLFALVEIGIGLYGFITILLFPMSSLPYRFLYNHLGSGFLFNIAYFLLAFIFLVIPTTLIGGTFPIVNKLIIKRYEVFGSRVGLVYSCDTLGAALGALVSGFLLMPFLGLSKTIILAALVNLSVGLIILLHSFDMKVKVKSITIVSKPVDKLIIVVFFLSGFAAMAYQVLWTRMLSLTFGTSTYSFATVLSAFLLGLAVGSYIFSRFVDRVGDLFWLLAVVELGIASSAVFLLFLFGNFDVLYFQIYSIFKTSFISFWLIIFCIIFFSLLVPTVFMGATFPIVGKIFYHSDYTIGRDIGIIFSSNTVGGIFGSFAAGFVLMPFLGMEKSVIVPVLLNLAIVFMLVRYVKRKMSFLPLIVILLIFFACMGIKTINPVEGGLYYFADEFKSLEEYEKEKTKDILLFKKDDPHGRVTVIAQESLVVLKINGKPDASNIFDLPTEYMLAYVPLLTHKNPKTVLNIGLGGGFTLSAIEDFSVKEIDVIEINPAVVEATKKVLSHYNDNALDDPRVNLIIADARNYLSTLKKDYDIIISEPSNPWLSGEGALFTREFYLTAKRHMKEDGIFCQWLPLYDFRSDDFKFFLRTFHSVFPYVQVYNVGGDAVVIGSTKRAILNYNRLSRELKSHRIKKHFQELRFANSISGGMEDPTLSNEEYFLSFYLMNSKEVKEYVGKTGRINTDDFPFLEFITAKTHMMRGISYGKKPIVDIIHFKMKQYGKFLVEPELEGFMREVGGKVYIEVFKASFINIEDWKLDNLLFGFYFTGPSQFYILRKANFSTPIGKLSIEVVDNVYGISGVEEIKEFLEYYWGIKNPKLLKEVREEENDHTAYLFKTGMKFLYIWYCEENSAIYYLEMPLGDNIEQVLKILHQIKCAH
jgi:spermidine synthase